MVTIQVKKAKFVKAPESMFISFKYDLDILNKVKSLPKRYYISDEKSWEVPVESVNDVLTLLADQEIKIQAPKVSTAAATESAAAPKKMTKEFDSISVDGFNFKTKPFDHQVEALKYSADHSKFLLGDEQGLGKTKQAIDIAVSKKNQFKHVLIVCGVNGLKRNWVNEVRTHSNEKAHILGSKLNKKGKLVDGSTEDKLTDLETLEDFDEYFLITNVESLRDVPKKNKNGTPKKLNKQEELQEKILKKLEALIADGTIGMVIVDEIHKCKNAKSQQGRAILRLRPHYRMALTGTPLMNKPLDLYVILNWLEMDKNSYYMFEKRYAVFGGYGGYEIVGYKNTDELHDKLKKVMLRRKKADVLNLPPKIRQTEYVEMTPAQRTIYAEILKGVKEKLKEISLDSNPLAQLLRLRQATGYTGILSDEVQESAKMDRMEEIIEELAENGQKAIVFSNWEEMTKVARKRLAQHNPAYITGSVDADTREAEMKRFQQDPNCKVIIGTIGAMGTGLTLTAANTVIFLDKPWNPANTEQAEDRAHRIGTTGTVNIVTLVCEGTIDERIEEILAEKGDIFDALVEGQMHKMSKYEMLEWLVA